MSLHKSLWSRYIFYGHKRDFGFSAKTLIVHWDVAYLAFVSFGLQALLSILYKFHGISPRFAVGTFKKLASLAFCCRNLRYPIPEAWSSKKLRWCGPSQVLLCLRAVGTRGPGGAIIPQVLVDTLTLFQSGGTLCPLHYYVALQIYRPSYGPVYTLIFQEFCAMPPRKKKEKCVS